VARSAETSEPGLFPENAPLPVSQVKLFLSDFMHEGRCFPVSRGRVGLCNEENAGLIKEADTQTGKSVQFGPPIRQRFQEDGNIVIGIRVLVPKK
jgi:hypothetical protein